MTELKEILDHLIAERDSTATRLSLLDNVIEMLQTEGSASQNLELLSTFIQANRISEKSKVIQRHSKMNEAAELIANYPGYKEAKSVKDKLVVILATKRRFLHIRDLGKTLSTLEFESQRGSNDWVTNISPVLSAMAKSNDRICKISEDGNKKFTLWGLIEWMEKGQPKENYLI